MFVIWIPYLPQVGISLASMRIEFGAFVPDNRGNRLEDYRFARSKQGTPFVLLRGPIGVVRQLVLVKGCTDRNLPESFRPEFTHCLQLNDEPDQSLIQLLELLSRVVTLPTTDELDLAIALDFYKDPTSDEDPMKWANTAAGELVNRAKYRNSSSAAKRLVADLTEVVRRHPSYSSSDVVLSVPGHKKDQRSFGVYLAEAVARATDKEYLRTTSRSTERPPAKEIGYSQRLQLEDEFIVPAEVAGKRALIIDDVYHSGASTRAVAAAARRAGVLEIRALVGARTMRS